jgi:iron complex outermembrane receptor protein
MILKSLSSGTALFAMAMSMPAFAQTTASAAATSDDTIIVTARKRAEDIQTVPISIVSLTAETLRERSINNLRDLGTSTPGLVINTIAGGALVTIYIRGQAPANTNNDLNTEANVGVFIDGIYQTSRNTVDLISVLDVGQIDVVKGPQSALYGRSTFAGALGIFTPAPSRELSGRIEATLGTNEDYRARGSVSGPIIKDKLFGRFSAGYINFGGTAENIVGENTGGYEKYAFSGSLEALIGDRLTARLNAFAVHSETEVGGIRLVKPQENNCGVREPITGFNVLRCGPLQTERVNNVSPDIPDTTFSTQQVSLDLTYESDNFSLVSVSGLTWSRNRTYNDYDGTSEGLRMGVCTPGGGVVCSPFVPPSNKPFSRLVDVNVHTSAREQVYTFSQELRIQSPDADKFQWMLGGFYFNSRIRNAFNPGVDTHILNGAPLTPGQVLLQNFASGPGGTGLPPGPGLTPTAGPVDFTTLTFFPTGVNDYSATGLTNSQTKTSSIFGSLGYDFGQVRIAAEGRYNIDDKNTNPLNAPGGIPISIEGPNPERGFTVLGTRLERKFKSFTPRFTIDYRPTEDLFFYASAAKGVRSGGFNVQSPGNPILPEEIPYEEEKNWTYEIGVKSNWLDNRLQVNLAAFRIDWSDMQIGVFSENPLASAIPTVIVANASSYRVEGVEGSIEVRPVDMFGFGGSFNFSNPRFLPGSYDTTRRTACIANGVGVAPCLETSTITTGTGAQIVVPDLTGKRTSRSVRNSWNLHATANVPLGNDWEATGRIDVNHTGNAFADLINSSEIAAFTLTNLRFGLNNDRYSIAVFATNLFDKIYVQNAIVQPRANLPVLIRVPEAVQAERRRVGITLTARY